MARKSTSILKISYARAIIIPRVSTYRQSGYYVWLFFIWRFIMTYYMPIALIVISNIFYNVCAKQTPESLNPFASLTVTYLVAAVFSAILFFASERGGNLISEYRNLNWSPWVLGIVIVGLEVGFIYAYKAGWQVSTASVVQSAVLSAALILVGWIFFKEPLTWNKLVGVGICLIGLVFINMK